jgi:hypothetical protein
MNTPSQRISILQALQDAYGNDAQWFPHRNYCYLRGYTTRRQRGICLIDDQVGGVVTRETVQAAYQEVKGSGLLTPFLFFGCSKLYGDDACIFMQVHFLGQRVIFPRVLYRT